MKKAMNQSTLAIILNGVSLFALLFMIISLFIYSSVSSQLNKANEDRFELTYNANLFMNGSSYLTNEVRAFATTGEKEHYDNYWNEVNNVKSRDQGVAAMQNIGITAEEQAMIDNMYIISNELVPLEEEAMNKAQAGLREEAISYVYGRGYNESIIKINSLKEQFLNDLNQRTLDRVEILSRDANYIKITMIFAITAVAVILFINMTINKKRILNPIIKIRDQMVEISKGNLSAEFPLKSDTSEIGMLVESIHETKRELKKYIKDIDFKLAEMAKGNMDLIIGNDYRGEFSPIQGAMHEILDALNIALSQINLTAEQVSEESKSLSFGAQTLSNGTEEQASAIKELSSNIQEISKQIERTSIDADNAQECSVNASAQLKLCENKMKNLTEAMENISKSSQEIGGIIKTIEDISFQTNILALNASVEAARAGNAGKGFAVVADEVQSLAYKSSASAQNIAKLIKNSMKLVQYGSSLSSDTMASLSEVISNSHKSMETVQRITEAATQQSNSVKQIKQGMEQISGVVQVNTSTARESADSAKKLNKQAEKLKISVYKFKLRKNK